jgi:glycosyltransferase involved in cell wall biosynthesis
VKEEAKQFLEIDENRIKVIFMGYDKIIFKQNHKEEIISFRKFKKLPEHFILFVGSIEPRKNLISLLKAYLLLPEYIKRDFKLLLVGLKGWKNVEILELLNKLKGNAEYLGFVDNEELAGLYRKASCFVYPSLYEGFGLPPLEAMACGCPVVTSDVASLPEVCGDAAYYINPYNVESIAEGIHKVLTDRNLRQNLIERGLERSKLFSWEKSAREHIKVFEEVSNS